MSKKHSTTEVEYRAIPGYPKYMVGSDGTVWRKLAPVVSDPGYPLVHLRRSQATETHRIHRLVLLAFRGPCPPGQETCHYDGNRQNNSLSNLRWDTSSANQEDMSRHGRKPMGQNCSHAKLTEQDVVAIRDAELQGEKMKDLAIQYGVAYETIYAVIRRRSWDHIK